jgi:hypothetical protein
MRRDAPYRFVLIVAALTMIATSAPEDFLLSKATSVAPQQGEVVHVTVLFSGPANEQAEEMVVRFTGGAQPVMVIPDDPAIAPFEVANSIFDLDALMVCPETGPCALGFSIDPGDNPNPTTVVVEGRAIRFGDASLCLPDDKSFKGDTRVEVTVD